jgi:hypothetical protein
MITGTAGALVPASGYCTRFALSAPRPVTGRDWPTWPCSGSRPNETDHLINHGRKAAQGRLYVLM